MNGLLEDRLAPITHEIGFLECKRDVAVGSYLKWMRSIYEKRGRPMVPKEVQGTLDEVLRLLLPLTSVDRLRFVFIPTASPWTGFFDNGHQGTDAFPPMSYLAEMIGCNALKVSYVPETSEKHFAARILNIYGPNVVDFSNTIRSIGVGYDGYKWDYASSGTVQPFEQLEYDTEDRIQDRFPYLLLERYLRKLGIRAFEEDFYLPNSAILIQKEGPVIPRSKEFGLDNDPPLDP